MNFKILLYCQSKDCLESIQKPWNGDFTEKWYCDKHKNQIDDKGGKKTMENEDIFSKGIGNKESKMILMPKPVLVLGKAVEPVKGKEGGKKPGLEVGKKLVLIVKHPDREEPVKISEIIAIVGKSVKTSTLWVNLDEDGNIQKGSTIATLLDKYQVPNVNALEGKTLNTEPDENKFLAIKCY